MASPLASHNPFLSEKHSEGKKSLYSNDLNTNTSSMNFHVGGQIQRCTAKVTVLEKPDEFSYLVLKKVMRFWEDNMDYLEPKFKGFKKEEEARIKDELLQIDEIIKLTRKRKPDFKNNDLIKQVFLLNIFNALVLYKLAVLIMCSCEGLTLLKSFNYHQAFLSSCKITIAGVNIDAFTIFIHCLRKSTP
mmetsp:Transcript_7348/g.6576  ORF Transcript_7348/g.6576 Transcript_7348/m.6576 type:complete len:189 (-) Transcript_7348:1930-2496(-)